MSQPKVAHISLPHAFSEWHRKQLAKMRNVQISPLASNGPFIEVGDSTGILMVKGSELVNGVRSGDLLPRLQLLDQTFDVPVLLIEGNMFDPNKKDPAMRPAVGFLTHVALTSNIRTIGAVTGFVACEAIQLIAKQAQFGSTPLGIESLLDLPVSKAA